MNTIYYFTGTGNSLKVAKDIIIELQQGELISISKTFGIIHSLKPTGTVGFVFPVYYCGLPQIVLEFIQKIDLSAVSYIYIAATFGSTLGNAGCISQAKRIFKEKKIQLNAAFYVRSVNNFVGRL